MHHLPLRAHSFTLEPQACEDILKNVISLDARIGVLRFTKAANSSSSSTASGVDDFNPETQERS